MELIYTDQAPKAVGPYSQAVQLTNGFLYISGQLGFDPKTMILGSDIKTQAMQVLTNINAILTAAHYNKNDVVKTTILSLILSKTLDEIKKSSIWQFEK
ncbi:Rid family hydrolase [Spiroplasma endosymbiont of Stenodema calcarata]|uniref:Rid family hydrolase n=1 Tax=Spiroplasma endosymbiont of Stenodema calcarata TaxID=3139328 RepID=UPI003CCB0D77